MLLKVRNSKSEFVKMRQWFEKCVNGSKVRNWFEKCVKGLESASLEVGVLKSGQWSEKCVTRLKTP